MRRFSLFLFLLVASCFAGPAFGGTCTVPAGNEGDILYNGDYHTYQFCNGTIWQAYGGGATCAAGAAGYSPTTPAGNGYFVLSKSTHNGNFTSLANANATCLTELTTNTGWRGYATANANGQLVAAKVFAFLCAGACNNLMPLATYYFANAGNSSAGGGSFTADTNGIGPNDNAHWGAANNFSGTYAYWTQRSYFGSGGTTWPNRQSDNNCSASTSSSSGITGDIGITYTWNARWEVEDQSDDQTCDKSFYFICIVNP